MTPRKRGHNPLILSNDPIFKRSWRLQVGQMKMKDPLKEPVSFPTKRGEPSQLAGAAAGEVAPEPRPESEGCFHPSQAPVNH